jgi:hypothetical protein
MCPGYIHQHNLSPDICHPGRVPKLLLQLSRLCCMQCFSQVILRMQCHLLQQLHVDILSDPMKMLEFVLLVAR